VLLNQLARQVVHIHFLPPGARGRAPAVVLEERVEANQHPVEVYVFGLDVTDKGIVELIIFAAQLHDANTPSSARRRITVAAPCMTSS